MAANRAFVALQTQLIERSQRFLQPGEEVQTAIPAWNPRKIMLLLLYLALPVIGWVVLFSARNRIILVSDRRIMVLTCSPWSVKRPRSVLREYPRSTRIGPVSGRSTLQTESLGETLRFWRQLSDDVTTADSWAASGSSPSPSAPAPDTAPSVSTLPSQ